MKQHRKSSPLRVGFVALTDCAPLVMAQELGLYRKYGLEVALQRELGWATVRDKLVYGELDASHALAAMPFAATLGLGTVPCPSLTALVLNLHGNAITFSRELASAGVTNGPTLREAIKKHRHNKVLTFGVVAPFSSHRHLLRKWLSAHGIDPERDMRIVVVPPAQMIANLKAGNLDGFCVGEPWNSAAVAARVGVFIATSTELDPHHPEKVLMVRRDFAEARSDEHLALVAALVEACEWCAAPKNHGALIATLAQPEYVGASAAVLRRGIEELCIFAGHDANEPSSDKAAWAIELIRASGLCPAETPVNFALARQVFRADLFAQAQQLRSQRPVRTNPKTKSEHENEPALV